MRHRQPTIHERREHAGKIPRRKVKVAGPMGYVPPVKSSPPTVHERREHEGKIKAKVPSAKPKSERAIVRQAFKGIHMPENPATAMSFARIKGIQPPLEIKKKYGAATYKRIQDAAYKHIAEHEGLKEDPLAELAISTLATAGVGGIASGVAKLAGKVGASEGADLLASGGSKIASKEATAATTAAEKGGAKIMAKLKGAPRAAAQAPAKKVRAIKSAPRRAKATVKRAPELKTSAGRRAAGRYAGKTAAHHPVRTSFPVATAIPTGSLPGDPGKRARAAIEGSVNALVNHPGETLKTTARSLPAAITAPVALGAAFADSVAKGTPAPLVNTAKEQAKGVEQIAAQTFSGDPKKAEEAARKEGSLAFLTPVPALSRLHAYDRARSGARAIAGDVRRKAASKSDWANRNIRHAPKGVEEPVFGFTARRQSRAKAAKRKQRQDNKARVAAAHHEAAITHAIARAPKGSDIALQVVAEYGIRSKKGVDVIRRGHGPGDAQLMKALDYLDAHPEIFRNKAFGTAVAAVKAASESAPAALADKGRRARLLPQGDVFGIAHPAARVPHHLRDTFQGAKTWRDALERLDALKPGHRANLRRAKAEKTIAKSGLDQAGRERARLRGRVQRETISRADGKLIGKRPIKGTKALERAELRRRQASDRYAKAKADLKTIEHEGRVIAEMRKQAKASHERSFKTRGADHYDNRLLNEYEREVEHAVAGNGLARGIYTRHMQANSDHGAGFQNNFPQATGRVEHMRLGANALNDNLDRSLEGLVRGVRLSRLQAAGKEWTRQQVDAERKPFTINGQHMEVGHGSDMWKRITGKKTKDNPDGGQYDPRFYARFAYREWKRALDDPYMLPDDRSRLMRGILDAAENNRETGSEPWMLLPRETIKEMRAQINPDHHGITNALNVSSRIATRTLLGTNPAWALAQTVAEGVPLLMAHPELLAAPGKVYTIERDLYRFRRDHPEEALALQATAGAAPVSGAALRTPGDMQETYTAQQFADGAKGLTRGKTARSALSFAKLRALGEFDVRRQNHYRQVLYAAEADKRFRSWHASVTGLFDKQAALSRKFKSREELWNWLSNDPKGRIEQQKLVDYVDNIQGDWTSFTSHERALAPLTLFYPFLRYSLRWTLWTFPRTHPITATLAYTLGQANSNQLEKLLGQEAYKEGLAPTAAKQSLANPLSLALPVYTNEKGEKGVLPGGSRISPGQSALTQALASGNPSQILSSANPLIGAGYTAFSGKEPLTGEKASMSAGWAALNSLAAMPAPARVPVPKGVPVLGPLLGGESAQKKVIGALTGKPQSGASKLYGSFDPNKTLRSVALPGVPLSGPKWAASELLSKEFDKKYGDPLAEGTKSPGFYDAQQEFIHGKRAPLRALVKQHSESEKARRKIAEWEEQFYPDSKGKLTKAEEERLKKSYELAQGGVLLPLESKRQKRKKKEMEDPFGFSSGKSNFEKEFGIDAGSQSSFEEEFGIK